MEKLEKLKKSLDNKFIPDNMKDKIRAEIKKLESEIKTDETMTATEVKEEVKEIEEKVEKALEVAEKKEEIAEAKAEEKKEKATRKAREKKASTSETKTQKVEQKATAKKKSVFSIAKEIRKDGESWEEAKKRATKMMKSDTTETKKKVRTETDKLLAMVRRNKEYKKLAGSSNLPKDASRRALPRGKRVSQGGWKNQYGESEGGKVYYENRANRVDVGGFKNAYLEYGGSVDRERFNKFISSQINYIISLKTISQKREPIQNLINNMDDYSGEEIQKRITKDNLKYALQQKTVSKINEVLRISLNALKYADGGTIIGTPETPLARGLDMDYTTLVGETGAMSSGELFAGGGELKGNFLAEIKVPYNYEKVVQNEFEFTEFLSKSLTKKWFGNGIWGVSVVKPLFEKDFSQKIVVKIDIPIGVTQGGGLDKFDVLEFISKTLTKKWFGNGIWGVDIVKKYAEKGVYVETLEEEIDLSDDGKPRVKRTQEGKKMSEAEWMAKHNDSMEARAYAEGGSLGNHGLKQGDQIIKTMSGGVQKVKTKSGNIVYVNLANGYRGTEPPLPFDKGGRTRERKYVNYSQDYEVRYSKDKPHRRGYGYAEGGVTKNYINRNELNTITIKKGDQKLTYKVSDVYNGAYKLENGGNLEKMAFYVAKRNVVKVQLKNGKDVKVANGYWIKKGAKPIHTSKYDDGGSVSDLDNKYVYISYEGQPLEGGEAKKIISHKYSDPKFDKKTLTLKFGDGSNLVLEKQISDFEKGKEVVIKSGEQYVAIELLDEKSEKYSGGGKIETKIQKKVDEVNALIEKAVDSDGDPLMVVDKTGTWEEPMQYKPIVYKNGRLYIEYFEPYSGKTEKEVINKSNVDFDGYPTLLNIAKMYRKALKEKGISYSGGGKTNTIEEDELMKKNGIVLLQGSPTISGQILARKNALKEIEKSEKAGESDVYPSMLERWKKNHKETIKKLEELKKSYSGGGKTTFKEKATAIAKNFEGKKVESKYQKEYGKVYDKAEAKEVGNKIAGSQKAKYDSKMSGGGSTEVGYFKNEIDNDYISEINKYFNKWNSIKTEKDSENFKKIKPPMFGTYQQTDILEQIKHFEKIGIPFYANEVSRNQFKKEVAKIIDKLSNSKSYSGGGSTKTKTKTASNNTMVLAKQIRKDGESWQSAMKRAKEELAKK